MATSYDGAISIRNLSKKYRLFNTPKERLFEALHPFRKTWHREHWALREVSFDIKRGETLGIVGRNGAGKSTLLQVIAGVTTPTEGEVTVRGRVSALLELGSGFNPEFTGRQNAIFQAQLMGFGREEIDRRLPAIEEFADIGEFFDQPVKTYSSGMFVRVAFAAAINVDPDILIVDEALAVGDAKFQHKCFLKFLDFKARGSTIIIVTHAVNYVTAHCDRAVLLEKGRTVISGDVKKVTDRYLELLFGGSQNRVADELGKQHPAIVMPPAQVDNDFFESTDARDRCSDRPSYNKGEYRLGDKAAEIIDYLIEVDGERDVSALTAGSKINIYLKALFHRYVDQPMIGFAIRSVDGVVLYGTNTFMQSIVMDAAEYDEIRVVSFQFYATMYPGDYFLDLGVCEIDGSTPGHVFDDRRSIIHIAIQADGIPTFDGYVDFRPEFKQICSHKPRDLRSYDA